MTTQTQSPAFPKNETLAEIPTRLETERLYLRCYEPGDGPWYYAMSQKNRSHLTRYEAGNAAMSITNEQEAETLLRELATDWAAQTCFFTGVFCKETDQFVAQVYIGPTDADLPEFAIGYFADCDYEGYGYVTEAVQAALQFAFFHLHAHRLRIECDDTNVRSYRVAERCGFVREGHIRQNKRNPDGTLSGTLHYGLLRSEYQGMAGA